MNKAKFYAHLRQRNSGLFGTSLSSGQVQGVEAILGECIAQGASLPQAAYILATGYGETGGKMQPVRENLNYRAALIAKHFGAHRRQGLAPQQLAHNPRLLGNTVYGGKWGKEILGNTQPNDGFDFRGGGIGQWTGRSNFSKVARQTGIDVLSNPALLDDLETNAKLLVRWMLNGGATGKKLEQYINRDMKSYHGARQVWGGVDASKYVGYAQSFEAALVAGGYDASTRPVATPERPTFVDHAPKAPTAQEVPSQGGLFAWLVKLLGAIGRATPKHGGEK